MFSYNEKMLNLLFTEVSEGAVAMAKCRCSACNSCSCGRCYGDDCISQCTGCSSVNAMTEAAWDSI